MRKFLKNISSLHLLLVLQRALLACFRKNIFPFVHTGVGSTRFGGVSGNSQNIFLSHLLGGKKQAAERARKNRRKLSAAVAPVHKKDTEAQYLSLEKACAFLYNF